MTVEKRRDKKNPINLYESLSYAIKILANPININQKTHTDNHQFIKFNLPHLDNRIKTNMNNIMSIDYANRDWTCDTDMLLPRMCMEFPRLSMAYKDRSQKYEKPWG